MHAFEIDIEQDASPADSPVGIAIRSRDIVFTRLIRHGHSTPEDYVKAPPGQLAFWFVDNWWRIVAECAPSAGQPAEWRLAHDLSSIGGFAWPRLAIWAEGERIGLLSRSDPVGVVGPVRYLTDALTYTPADEFVRSVLAFIDTVASDSAGLASDRSALRAQVAALNHERSDPDLTAWRRLEAQLGYDVDDAPEALLFALARLAGDYGEAAVSEAALATQGAQAAAILQAEIDLALEQHWQCDLARTAQMVADVGLGPDEAPWELAERAAAAVRLATGRSGGPLSNAALGDILGVHQTAFRSGPTGGQAGRAYGVRLNTGRKRGEVVSLATSWPTDRRFEFARALGDAIWTRGHKLGLITRAKSERQKFQRAFAQSLLCPYEALIAYIGNDVTDGAITAAARHFLVSERVVRTLLVNKRDLARSRLGNTNYLLPRPTQADALDDAVEAA